MRNLFNKRLSKSALRKHFSDQKGWSLAELIFVMMISSILGTIAIPRLQQPVKRGINTIKDYTKKNFNAGVKGQAVSQEFRLINTKIIVKSYFLSAKDYYIRNTTLPKTARDLSIFQEVIGCKVKSRNRGRWFCERLEKQDLNVSEWDTLKGNYKIKMIKHENEYEAKLYILAIPYLEEGKGITGCYNSREAITNIRIFKKSKKGKKLPLIKC